jgi:uncharacterized iron-regulated membrane protein
MRNIVDETSRAMKTVALPQSSKLNGWQQWLEQPHKLRLHNAVFQIHFWIGAIAAMYLAFMSITGSILVYRNELSQWTSLEWLVNLDSNLLAGSTGRFINGIGGACLTVLCLTGIIVWWPGVKNWRRSLTVNWGTNFARRTWDLHSALGFWCLFFVLVWGLSGFYFAFPDLFAALLFLDPSDKVLLWLTELHFGRFGWFAEAVWSLLGLVPALLALTGIFICCRRVIFKKPSHPNRG